MCSNQIIAQMHNIIDGQLALQVGILRQLIPALLPLSNLPDTAAGILVQRDIEPIDQLRILVLDKEGHVLRIVLAGFGHIIPVMISSRTISIADGRKHQIAFIVHTQEQASFSDGFLIREGNGYSYHFQYILPYDTIQNEIPEEAISILSTLSIQESSENTD